MVTDNINKSDSWQMRYIKQSAQALELLIAIYLTLAVLAIALHYGGVYLV